MTDRRRDAAKKNKSFQLRNRADHNRQANMRKLEAINKPLLASWAEDKTGDAPWWSEDSAKLHAASLRNGILPGQEVLLTGLLLGAAEVTASARRQLLALGMSDPELQPKLKPIIDTLLGLSPPK